MSGSDEGAQCCVCGRRHPRYVCRSCGSFWCHSDHKKYGKLKWGYGVCGNCGEKSVAKR